MKRHVRLPRRTPAFLEIARRTGRGDIFPCRSSPLGTRYDVVEGQVLADPTILALEAVAQEQVEPGESGIFRRADILLERDD